MKQALIVMMAFLAISCGQKKAEKVNTNIHEIVALEVIQSSGYTYMRFTENGVENWLATAIIDAKVGETYYYEKGEEMGKFHSKELNRDFDNIIFVDRLKTEPSSDGKKTATSPGSEKAKAEKMIITIDKAKDELTIADLYAKKDVHADKLIILKGKVVKFSPGIMNKNWVHLQDGTEFEGNYDITVTTLVIVNVGDIVTFQGKIVLDKDFGHGYKYDLLLEEAVIK